MLAENSATTARVRGLIGKAALNERVMRAIGKVPRHEFVPIELQPYAYANRPLPIGFDKTISQPFIVALMTDLLEIGADNTVLEIGTGLGYQTAILAQLAKKIYSIEIIEELGEQARKRLRREGCTNVELKIANGYHGWSEHAPFDRVIVTAAPDLIPPPLIHQLKKGGKMVIPAGLPDAQQLMLVDKDADGRVAMREVLPVRFSQFETWSSRASGQRGQPCSRLPLTERCWSRSMTGLRRNTSWVAELGRPCLWVAECLDRVIDKDEVPGCFVGNPVEHHIEQIGITRHWPPVLWMWPI
jgi:protein-L-isoaspartate(D-aspartate) O-methyltransferase